MVDKLSEAARSKLMSRVRQRDTAPELKVRRLLHLMGFRFRLHRKDLPGCPDIVLPKYKLVIFVHGCFWHQHEGCKKARLPATRTEWWAAKLRANIKRDELAVQALDNDKWNVCIIWECETHNETVLSTHLRKLMFGTDEKED